MPSLRLIHTFCHTDDCCPQLFEDTGADEAQRFVITDDFGNEIRVSQEQLALITSFDVSSIT